MLPQAQLDESTSRSIRVRALLGSARMRDYTIFAADFHCRDQSRINCGWSGRVRAVPPYTILAYARRP